MDKNDEILIDDIDERIEAFLRGEMSAEEEASFKQEIRQNSELRSRAKTMAFKTRMQLRKRPSSIRIPLLVLLLLSS